jgi:hypothetical protein
MMRDGRTLRHFKMDRGGPPTDFHRVTICKRFVSARNRECLTLSRRTTVLTSSHTTSNSRPIMTQPLLKVFASTSDRGSVHNLLLRFQIESYGTEDPESPVSRAIARLKSISRWSKLAHDATASR